MRRLGGNVSLWEGWRRPFYSPRMFATLPQLSVRIAPTPSSALLDLPPHNYGPMSKTPLPNLKRKPATANRRSSFSRVGYVADKRYGLSDFQIEGAKFFVASPVQSLGETDSLAVGERTVGSPGRIDPILLHRNTSRPLRSVLRNATPE